MNLSYVGGGISPKDSKIIGDGASLAASQIYMLITIFESHEAALFVWPSCPFIIIDAYPHRDESCFIWNALHIKFVSQ